MNDAVPVDVPVPATPPPAPAPFVGARLTQERVQQGLSLGEVARQLKLSVKQLEALENDDYAVFPGPVFVRGFLRNYARFLRLDPDDLVAAAAERLGPAVKPAPQGVSMPSAVSVRGEPFSEGRRRWYFLASLVLLAVVAFVLVGTRASRQRGEPSELAVPIAPVPQAGGPAPTAPPAGATPQPSSPLPVGAQVPASEPSMPGALPAGSAPLAAPAAGLPLAPVQPGAGLPLPAPVQATPTKSGTAAAPAGTPAPRPTPPATVGAELRLSFNRECWVDVRDQRGEVLAQGMQQASTQRVLSGMLPLSLVLGDARAVSVVFRDQPVDLAPHVHGDVARLTLQ